MIIGKIDASGEETPIHFLSDMIKAISHVLFNVFNSKPCSYIASSFIEVGIYDVLDIGGLRFCEIDELMYTTISEEKQLCFNDLLTIKPFVCYMNYSDKQSDIYKNIFSFFHQSTIW